MNRYDKLFRAIVIIGASMTTSACGSECARCSRVDAPSDTVAMGDAGVDSPSPRDAPVDVVVIL